MPLRDKQSKFLINLAKLILWVNEQPGWQLTGGELYRPQEMQDIYVAQGKSKTKNGKHPQRLACDLNLFINGVFQTEREAYKLLAEYWKSLDADNVAGYDWGFDANHFESK